MRFDFIVLLTGVLMVSFLSWHSHTLQRLGLTTHAGIPTRLTKADSWYQHYEELTQLIKLQPQSRDLYLLRAIYLTMLNRINEAQIDVEKAKKLDPNATKVLKVDEWMIRKAGSR